MKLRDIDILPAYSTDDGKDLLDTFYNPVLECAVKYDRVTGFFSPKVFAIAARGFRKCVENNCKIRIITSVCVEDETWDAINESTRLSNISKCLDDYNLDSVHDELDYNYLQLFMYLYSTGMLEMKVAAVREGNGIFHEKIGIITDSSGDSISFSGSNNETASGWINNIEEFKVFKDWEPVQATYCSIDKKKFETYWDDENNRFKVLSLDRAESEGLIRKTLEPDLTIEEIKKRIYEQENAKLYGGNKKPKTRQLRPYQKDAISHWKNSNYISIFEMATGTGKTFTTVSALKQFREDNGSLHCVVGVPLISLLVQWRGELLTNFGEDLKIIVASSSVDNDWRKELSDLTIRLKMGLKTDFAILVPYVTLSNNEFVDRIKRMGVEDMVFLADEMHNLVTERAMSVLSDEIFRFRLGLSATPVRLWAPEESKLVTEFFGDNPYVFSLERAISDGFLVPYNYYVKPVFLTEEEFEEYCGISREIGRYSAMGKEYKDSALNALLKRARIKKNAENKLLALSNVIAENKKALPISHSLFYVDNTDMLEKVQKVLMSYNIISSKFTGEEDLATREDIIDSIRRRDIDAIVAIKCLDEGVDIPSARNAYFISSNTDPREYVQRLGRVLRLDEKSGKTHSNIYDFIVLPPSGIRFSDISERNIARNLVRNEVIRAKFFCKLAKNAESAQEEVEDIVGGIGMTFTEEELDLNNKENIIDGNIE